MLVGTTAERVARNQSAFRAANERLEAGFSEIGPDVERLPFICECFEPECKTTTLLTLVEYEGVRSHGSWFLVVPEHALCLVDGEEVARIAKRYDRYTIMEKVGEAGEIAKELDPRGGE
jgi:hypothetical protein